MDSGGEVKSQDDQPEHIAGVARIVLNFFTPPGNQTITLSARDATCLARAALKATERSDG